MGCLRSPFGAQPGKDDRPPRDPARGIRFPGPCRRAVHGIFLLLVVFLPACGYRLQGSPGSLFADPGIRVDLRPFTNESFVPAPGDGFSGKRRDFPIPPPTSLVPTPSTRSPIAGWRSRRYAAASPVESARP